MQKSGRTRCTKALSYTWLIRLSPRLCLKWRAQLHAAYMQLACGWWVYFLQMSISTLVTPTNTGVIALRIHPPGTFESQNSSGCSFHPTTQKSRGSRVPCSALPIPLSAPSRGEPVLWLWQEGTQQSWSSAVPLARPMPLPLVWLGNKRLQQRGAVLCRGTKRLC